MGLSDGLFTINAFLNNSGKYWAITLPLEISIITPGKSRSLNCWSDQKSLSFVSKRRFNCLAFYNEKNLLGLLI